MPFRNGGFDVKSWWGALTVEQRLSLVLVGVCGIGAVSLSFLFLSGHVNQPFLVPISSLEPARSFYQQQQADNNALDDLKKKDSDQDGLNDYAELYVYHTSPYLADSDSDGIPDAVEIAMGTDPNCPKGSVCHEQLEENPATSTSKATVTGIARPSAGASPADLSATSTLDAATMDRVQNFLNNPAPPESMNAAQTRQYLRDSGVITPDQAGKLDQLTDAEVLRLYQATYKEAISAQGSDQTGGTSLPNVLNGL